MQAMKEASRPSTPSEVRSFLGLVGFSSRFIPDFATIAEPLRALTRNGVKFEWTKVQENAFQTLKEQLAKVSILAQDQSHQHVLNDGYCDYSLITTECVLSHQSTTLLMHHRIQQKSQHHRGTFKTKNVYGKCYGIIQPTEKYQKLSLKSTNLINYTSSDNYNLGATLAQYNLTTNYLEPIINLQSPLTQTHSRHCYHQTSWSHLE